MTNIKNKNDLAGYFGETDYPSLLNSVFTPHSIAGCLRWHGIKAPQLRAEFTQLDIGCGDGIGLCLIAASYPQAKFVGVDAMPEHIKAGQQFAQLHGITNVELICQTFEQFIDAPETDIGKFDFITSQGVIAWVSEVNRQFVFDIVAQYLADDGSFTVGYNSQPGWQNKMSSQQLLLRFLGQQQDKSPQALSDNINFIETIAKAGTKSVTAEVAELFKEFADEMPHDYMLHEYLNQCWQPLWFGEVCTELQKRGLDFVTHASFTRLREDFSLRKAQREAIEGISDPLQRQTAVDILQNTQFRTDIYKRRKVVDDATQTRKDVWLMAKKPQSEVELVCLTQAGKLKFDNPAVRDVLDQLDSAPKTFDSICKKSPHPTADALNAVETLLVAGIIHAVAEPIEVMPAAELNKFLIDYVVEKEQNFINAVVTRHGAIAIKLNDFVLLGSSDSGDSTATQARFGM